MAYQIEILSLTNTSATLLLYYPVDIQDYLPLSSNPDRDPKGTGLSAQDIQDIKDGRLIEKLEDIRIPAENAAVRQLIESQWNKFRQAAYREYRNKYFGRYYDGTDWSE